MTTSAAGSKKAPATAPTDASVEAFLAAVADERRRDDARSLAALMTEITGETPRMWGPSIVGFGSYHYRYESGREGDAPLTGFSPRKTSLVVYLVGGYEERYPGVLAKLGKHKTGKGCLYLNRLADADEATLRELIDRSVRVHRGANT
ncbi:DUF1801 domain-containing protein [Asanoa siamensis]|uniref:YdhG-like domain-containing protein n=1 Tax=Asanoa siamensis TaxID=926357 RepID=A0ABQ4D101_9ACTN|nr:DUF1801 domain-containing protein [Asanoa siamensis]GIF77221.1 hypothetical protein Asi02nite_67390 [Asanoa siamensis]